MDALVHFFSQSWLEVVLLIAAASSSAAAVFFRVKLRRVTSRQSFDSSLVSKDRDEIREQVTLDYIDSEQFSADLSESRLSSRRRFGVAKPMRPNASADDYAEMPRSAGDSGTNEPLSENVAEHDPDPDGDLETPQDGSLYRVGYATNRAPIDPADISVGYSGRRGTETRYGNCDVLVPHSHKIGSIGSSILKRLWTRVDDRLKLERISLLSADHFWKSLNSRLTQVKSPRRQAVIFLHGYNVSFEHAALRAAQLGTDLGIPAMAFFSWPSKGDTDGYAADGASIEASEGVIRDFLIDFAENAKADGVSVIAHSMGNRGLMRAVSRIASDAERISRVPFAQFILAAPDVDADSFGQLAAAYSQLAKRTTLYISERDRAVALSRWLHDYPRVGYAPPITVVPGIDTVNVTNVDLTMLGHGYVGDAREVLTDMHQVIFQDLAPSARFGLKEGRTEQGQRYWTVGG